VTQPTQDEAVRTLQEGRERVGALLDGLTQDQLIKPSAIGGGDWSAKDLIGHIGAWERLALVALGEWRRGERPSIEDTFAEPGGVDDLNAVMVEQRRSLSLEDVLLDADKTHGELIEELSVMSNEEWSAKASYAPPSSRRRRLATLLGSILGAPQRPFGHAFAHLPDLESYVTSLR
jgi:uncharacterized protein (TIGR03083 family)